MMIRHANSDDAPALAAMHLASWREAYAGIMPAAVLDSLSLEARIEALRRALADPLRVTLLGEIDGQIVGYAAGGPTRDDDRPPDGRTGELYALYLRAAYWGQGHGRALWEAARQMLLDQGFDEITLWVLEANTRGRRFYEKAGFVLERGTSKWFTREGVNLPQVRYRARKNGPGGTRTHTPV